MENKGMKEMSGKHCESAERQLDKFSSVFVFGFLMFLGFPWVFLSVLRFLFETNVSGR